jgi:BAI1-associated protein 3
MFSVKDKDYFGMSNQYLAESFISFSEIADVTSDSGKIQQIHLKLNRPKKLGKNGISSIFL